MNKDGKANSADALSILKMAVHLSTTAANERLFVSDSVGSDTMSRTAVQWPDVLIPLTIDHQDQFLQLVGIVKGDVNGSWLG